MTVIDLYVLTAIALFVKMFAVSLYQGYWRISRMVFRNREDAVFLGRDPADEELPQVRRAQQVWLNDLENIPIFLALAIAYVVLQADSILVPWLFGTFVVARTLHTLAYLGGVQPWRTVLYGLGVAVIIVMCVDLAGHIAGAGLGLHG